MQNHKDIRRQRGGKGGPSGPPGQQGPSAGGMPKFSLQGTHYSRVAEMFGKDFSGLVQSFIEKPLQWIGGLIALMANFVTAIAFFGNSNGNNGGSPAGAPRTGETTSFLLSNFPMRVATFIMIAATLAWTASMINIWLTKKRSQPVTIAAHVMTAVLSLFLAACIDWIFQTDLAAAKGAGAGGQVAHSSGIILQIFILIGVGLGVFLAKMNYRLTLEPDPAINIERTSLLMNFAVIAVFLVFLRMFIN